jgi:hypothetical protein
VSLPAERERVRLGSAHGAAMRRRVYRTPLGIEVDEVGGFELSRRRVLWGEVRLVTLHRGPGSAAGWVFAVLAAAALVLGLLAGPAGIGSYLSYGVAALFLYGAVFYRLPAWWVTVFGRRTKAAMRFRQRETRARWVYAEVCRRVAEAQEALAARNAAQAPPPADPLAGIPQPPREGESGESRPGAPPGGSRPSPGATGSSPGAF